MILQAINEFKIDPKKSVLIGDKPSDIEAAKNANLANSYQIGIDGANLYEIYEKIKDNL